MKRLLRRWLGIADPVPVEFVAPHLSTEQWQEAMKHATSNAFQVGHAQGELHGRRALAAELESEFPVDGGRAFDEDAARSVRLRQLH